MASNGNSLKFAPWQDGVEFARSGDFVYFRVDISDKRRKAAPRPKPKADGTQSANKMLANSRGWQNIGGDVRANVMVLAPGE